MLHMPWPPQASYTDETSSSWEKESIHLCHMPLFPFDPSVGMAGHILAQIRIYIHIQPQFLKNYRKVGDMIVCLF